MLYDAIVVDGENIARRFFSVRKDLDFVGFVLDFVLKVGERYKGVLHLAWDSYPSIRKDDYPEYKANRKRMPEDEGKIYWEGKDQLRRLFPLTGVHQWVMKREEGDDIVFNLARQLHKEAVLLVSSDHDLYQVVEDSSGLSIHVLDQYTRGKFRVQTEHRLTTKYGFHPRHLQEVMGLTGCSKDNIPGVKGVGEVYATKVVKACPGWVIAFAEDQLHITYKGKRTYPSFPDASIPPKVKAKILKSKDEVKRALSLVELRFISLREMDCIPGHGSKYAFLGALKAIGLDRDLLDSYEAYQEARGK